MFTGNKEVDQIIYEQKTHLITKYRQIIDFLKDVEHSPDFHYIPGSFSFIINHWIGFETGYEILVDSHLAKKLLLNMKDIITREEKIMGAEIQQYLKSLQ